MTTAHVFDPACGAGHLCLFEPPWIPYAAADQGLERLRWLYDNAGADRSPGLLIWGPTNNGKTSLAYHFARRMEEEVNRDCGTDGREPAKPVAYVQMPPSPDLGAFFGGILRSVGVPTPRSARWENRQTQLLTVLPRLKTRMLIVDELDNLLQGKRDQQTAILNSLKFLSNELKIPVVGIGTNAARIAVQTDQQLGNRLHPFALPRWSAGKAYALIITKMIMNLGLDPDLGKRRPLVDRIHFFTDGLIGETWHFMTVLRDAAAKKGTDAIDENFLDTLPWAAPQLRRGQTAERQARAA